MNMRSLLSICALSLALVHTTPPAQATTCGTAYFNHDVTYWGNSPLYYTVAGAPANTCGDLYANRNGGGYQLNAADWICTNGSGSATMGPWTWNNQADDETSYVYIDWGTCTSPIVKHIWDVDSPEATRTSSCPYLGGPSAFSGTAADDDWGAGFDSDWADSGAEYYNETTGMFWNPSTGAYDSTWSIEVPCTNSGMPSMNITWNCSIPSAEAHVGGHEYYWSAYIRDIGLPAVPVPYCRFLAADDH